MANEQFITIRGRVTGDPELRFTPSGTAVANFTIAQNARTFDKNSNSWVDGETTFWRCQAWREIGENAADSLSKGVAVIALATLETRKYTTKDNEERTVLEARVEAIGPDLRWATAKVNRPARGAGEGGPRQQQGAPGGAWGAQQAQNTAWGNTGEQPPF